MDNKLEEGSREMPQDIPLYRAHRIDHDKSRYPHCIVWCPIPLLTWIFPFIGHMGIGTTSGVIRDFAGPYYVSEDCMAFGIPTRYWQLKLEKVRNGSGRELWDKSVHEASEEYKGRIHNLCCDNCHSHVAMALNLMGYDQKSNWNMVKLAAIMFVKGKYVGVAGFLKTWLPFVLLLGVIVTVVLVTKFHMM
ncbi:unnamed protein product [Owenia fusiformis]|uniref:Uncharacterized protein n=1 Tax=Owenia fusiformis TaxID=6347 RepID=A0A8J1TPR6_OWEFU|nr:unnamed protein product [Owenia fusiformis]